MRSRLYENENFPVAVVEQLRQLGHNVATMKDRGVSNQRVSDLDVVDFACKDQRAVITFNKRDFARIHRMNPDHHGMVLCTVDPDLDALAIRIHETITSFGNMKGKVIRVHR